jgi:hypothetical protein
VSSRALCVFNGTDYVQVGASAGGSTTQVQYDSSGALAGSANFTFNGTTATINTLNLTNALGVAYGGTGTSSLTANNVVLGNGTSAVQVVAPSTNGNVLTSNGTTWVYQAPAASGVSPSQGNYDLFHLRLLRSKHGKPEPISREQQLPAPPPTTRPAAPLRLSW